MGRKSNNSALDVESLRCLWNLYEGGVGRQLDV